MKWRQYASAYFGLCQIRGKGIGWVDFHGMTRKCFEQIGELVTRLYLIGEASSRLNPALKIGGYEEPLASVPVKGSRT